MSLQNEDVKNLQVSLAIINVADLVCKNLERTRYWKPSICPKNLQPKKKINSGEFTDNYNLIEQRVSINSIRNVHTLTNTKILVQH